MSRTRVNVAAGAAAAFLALAAAIAVAAPAAAHSQVIATNPADGSTVTVLPEELSVTANEDLADLTGTGQGFALILVGADGTRHETTPLTIDGPRVSAPVPEDLPAGDYTLLYQIVSADTHPVSGSIHFSYDPSGTAVPGETRPTSQPTGGTVGAVSDPGATSSATDSDDPNATAVATVPTWVFVAVPIAIVVVIAAIVWVVLARRRPGR